MTHTAALVPIKIIRVFNVAKITAITVITKSVELDGSVVDL